MSESDFREFWRIYARYTTEIIDLETIEHAESIADINFYLAGAVCKILMSAMSELNFSDIGEYTHDTKRKIWISVQSTTLNRLPIFILT